MKMIDINKTTYHVECIPFEDKSEINERGYYDYYYEGVYIFFYNNSGKIRARIYSDTKDEISFSAKPIQFFGEDFEGIKAYIRAEFGAYKIKFFDLSNKVSGYTPIKSK